MIIELKISGNKFIHLTPLKETDSNNSSIYLLIDQNNDTWLRLRQSGSNFVIIEKSEEIIETSYKTTPHL